MPLRGAADDLVLSLLSRLYSERGEYAGLAKAKLRDGSTVAIRGRDLVSGAVLENVVRNAAEEAAEPALLNRLTRLEAEIENQQSETRYRFAAADAYYGLVRGRIDELLERFRIVLMGLI